MKTTRLAKAVALSAALVCAMQSRAADSSARSEATPVIVQVVADEADRTGEWSEARTDVQAAITAAGEVGTVYFRAGVYRFAETLNLTAANQKLVGESRAETVLDGGGAVRILSTAGFAAPEISHFTFRNGVAGDNGGAILLAAGAGAFRVEDCDFLNNAAKSRGGAVCSYRNEGGVVTNCLFAGNAVTETVYGSSMGGGAYYAEHARGRADLYTTVSDCVFSNNCAKGETPFGGAVLFRNAGRLAGCLFVTNMAETVRGSSRGGSVYLNVAGQIADCTFMGYGKATYGQMAILGGASIVTNCQFRDVRGGSGCNGLVHLGGVSNAVVACTFTGIDAADYVMAEDTRGTLVRNCLAVGNTGGAFVRGHNGASSTADATRIEHCTFAGNAAAVKAVNGTGSCSTNVFVNCVFVDNHATNGGGLYCLNYFQSVKDCVFMDNATTANGGGLYAYATIDVIEGTAFDGNRAVEKGGCLYAESGLETAMGCTFKNGVSDGEFGGVYLSSYGGAFKGCLFESNTNKTATVNGSHVNNAQSATDCIFRGWGDLRVQRFSRCTFDRCVYFAGEGSAEDGLVTFVSWRESGSIENCLFAGCSTSVLIYNKSNKTVPIVNCTFADNTLRHWGKHDGFLFFAHRADAGLPSTNVIVNSIFSGNRVATEASAASGESVPCDFMANATTYKVESSPCLNLVSNAVYVTYDAVYSKNNPTQFSKFRKVADVGFVGESDPALPPYALRKDSRAINRGLNAGWTAEDTDLAGSSRVQGQAVDLGCYESPFDRGFVLVVR